MPTRAKTAMTMIAAFSTRPGVTVEAERRSGCAGRARRRCACAGALDGAFGIQGIRRLGAHAPPPFVFLLRLRWHVARTGSPVVVLLLSSCCATASAPRAAWRCGRGVARYLIGRGDDGLSGKHLEYRLPCRTCTPEDRAGRCNGSRSLGTYPDDAVLKRVVADHADAPAGVRPADGSFPGCFFRTSSSPLTSMRRAWNVRLAGCPPAARACRDGCLDDVDQLRARFKRCLSRARTMKSAMRLAHRSSE